MIDSHLNKCLTLRLLIGYLGERSQFGWWPTSFFDPSSRLFLDPVFPKTKHLAQYHGVSEAGRRLHDEYIGIGNVYHLFRLPEEVEQYLHKAMQDMKAEDPLLINLTDKNAAIDALSAIADGTKVVKEGPVVVGKYPNSFIPNLLKEVAQSYLSAFRQGIRTYPYFMGS